mgnify:CR=1 FL=1
MNNVNSYVPSNNNTSFFTGANKMTNVNPFNMFNNPKNAANIPNNQPNVQRKVIQLPNTKPNFVSEVKTVQAPLTSTLNNSFNTPLKNNLSNISFNNNDYFSTLAKKDRRRNFKEMEDNSLKPNNENINNSNVINDDQQKKTKFN